MNKAPNSRDLIRGTAPKLIELTEEVIYGDVWEREELSKRDRSLITIASLIAMGRERQLVGHLGWVGPWTTASLRMRLSRPLPTSPSIPAGPPP
jgi:hypothetical protein